MTPGFISSAWTVVAPALGNHLWQSTLFVIAAWLLTLLWRKNHARTRYWLWLAASIKFLVPFSLLVSIGNWFAAPRVLTETNGGFSSALYQFSQPFTQASAPAQHLQNNSAIASLSWSTVLPLVLTAAWLGGLLVVILVWHARWRRISRIISNAGPLQEGREVEALRRLQGRSGIKPTLKIMLSQASIEPGVFGIFRPLLLWPEGISERLGDEHLEAILAHELWHVRRRDNLAASLHMIVQAVFWFHPLVWWLGTRLVEERERACDQEVLALGSQRQIYAESILKTCEFCLEAPLPCISGVAGADLKKRIVHIMTQGLAEKLGFGKKLLLATIGAAAIAAPVMFGLLHVPLVRAHSAQTTNASYAPFEVASIKPSRPDDPMVKLLYTRTGLSAENYTVDGFIRAAYDVQANQIIGAPGWLSSAKYDVEAKVDSVAAQQHTSPLERRLALQQLLADRWKLKLHRETRDLPVYELVVAKNGPRLKESSPGDTYAEGAKRRDGHPIGPGIWMLGRGDLASQGEPMTSLITVLSRQMDRPIVDKTGLNGNYDFTLKWTPEESPGAAAGSADSGQPAAAPESSAPSIFVAVEEQLGLKLMPKKGPVEVLVIDHIEKASEN